MAELSSEFDAIEFLERAQNLSPNTTRILLAQQLSFENIQSAVNRSQVARVFDYKAFSEKWDKTKRDALLEHEQSWQKSQLLKESNQQLRELDVLNANLEKTVEERTTHIQNSKEEEEEKLNKVRLLIRFIRDLSESLSFEEILSVVRREFRKLNKVGEPHLLFTVGTQKTEVVSFASGQIRRVSLSDYIQLPPAIAWNDAQLTKQLANHLGRPLMRMISIPLEVGNWKRFDVKDAQATLCIENSLSENEMGNFLDFALERVRAISLVVDKTLLESEMALQSFRWEKTFDGLSDPISIINSDYEVLRANKKFANKSPISKCYEIFADRQSPCEGCPLQETLEQGHSAITKVKIKNKTYELHSYPIRWDPKSKAMHTVHQYVDVTHARELYMKMLHSEKMSAVGLLAGNIAHELNNPLTGLRSLAQVLIHQVPPESELSKDLTEIEKATQRSQKIIRHLIDFSKGQSLTYQDITWDEVVERTLPLVRTMTRTHRFEMDLDSAKSQLSADPQLLQQVLFNLVNNACQAMPKPGRLAIKTFFDEAKNQTVLEVEDTGAGIPSEFQSKIFEPFFTTKGETQGTGLGLSLSKDIVEKLGGSISFSTVENQGTVFRVSLPVIRVKK